MKLRIKEVIKSKGLDVKSLADILGMNRVSLSNIINGNPTLETLQKIATALNVEIWELFTESTAKGDLYGFIEYRQTVYKIDSKEALTSLLVEVEKEEN